MARRYDWRVEVAPGADLTTDPSSWPWQDATAYVRMADGISIDRGRRDEFTTAAPQRASLTVDNRDGRWLIRNPLGPWYGLIRRNMPLRVRKRHVRDLFARTVSNGWGTSDSGRVWTTSGGSTSDFSVASGTGRHSVGTLNVSRRSLLDVTLVDSEQTVDVTVPTAITGASLITSLVARRVDANNYYWFRVEFNLNTGTGLTVTCKITQVVAGVGTDLATASPVPGLLYTAGQPVHVRAQVAAQSLRLKAWTGTTEPTGWTLTTTANVLNAAGGVGWQEILTTGNTNTLPLVVQASNYQLLVDRFTGLIDALPSRRDVSGRNIYSPITASGITRRLTGPAATAVSAPAQYIPTTLPVGYWPLENGQLTVTSAPRAGANATDMKPYTGSHPSGAIVTYPQWGQGQLAPWLPPTVSRSGNIGLTVLAANVPTAGFNNAWTVDWMYASGSAAAVTTIDINPSYLGGDPNWPQVIQKPNTLLLQVAMNGEPEVNSGVPGLYDGNAHHVRFTALQNGTKVSWTVWVDGLSVNTGTTAGTMTLTAINAIGLAAEAQSGGSVAQGHVVVYQGGGFNVDDAVAAALGYPGELAAQRIGRLCGERDVPVAVTLGPEPLGPQPTAPLMTLLREAESTDGGVLYERATGELGYVSGSMRYNQPVTLSLDYDAAHIAPPFEPLDDDQQLRNSVTASRTNGGSVTFTDPVSAAAEGIYEDPVTVNTQGDDRLTQVASWRAHLGTADARRWPALVLQPARWSNTIVDQWLSTDVTDRVQVAHVPEEQETGGLVDLHVEGYQETLTPYLWTATANCAPAEPWQIAVADGPQRVDNDGATLSSAATSSATSLLLAFTAAGRAWTTDAALFPLDIVITGERITLSGITGTTSPQTATVSARAVNGVVKAHAAGEPVHVWQPAIVGL